MPSSVNDDPELFPMFDGDPIKLPKSNFSSKEGSSTKKDGTYKQRLRSSSTDHNDDVFPSPSQILSQPKSRSRKTGEDWDADYLPPSTAPAATRRTTRRSSLKSHTRRNNPTSAPQPRASDLFVIPASSDCPEDGSAGGQSIDGAVDEDEDWSSLFPPRQRKRTQSLRDKDQKKKFDPPSSPDIKVSSSQPVALGAFPSTAPNPSTHIIDLTMASDQTGPSSDADGEGQVDGVELPRGPGWVKKGEVRVKIKQESESGGNRAKRQVSAGRTRSVV